MNEKQLGKLRQVGKQDQTDAAQARMARMVAAYYNALIEQGVPHENATQLTVAYQAGVLNATQQAIRAQMAKAAEKQGD